MGIRSNETMSSSRSMLLFHYRHFFYLIVIIAFSFFYLLYFIRDLCKIFSSRQSPMDRDLIKLDVVGFARILGLKQHLCSLSRSFLGK